MTAWTIYDALIDRAQSGAVVEDVVLGINWSVCKFSDLNVPGICFSASHVARTLPWSGSLIGRSINELKHWVKDWEPAAASVGVMAINACINSGDGALVNAQKILPSTKNVPNNLLVFDYFRHATEGKKVAVIGRYPGLTTRPGFERWTCFEINPQAGDLPSLAAPYILPDYDWVFITGATIANKSLPAILNACGEAQLVLMGPSIPWTPLWADFGVNYLAGVAVNDWFALKNVACQAGGTQLFNGPCDYFLVDLAQ